MATASDIMLPAGSKQADGVAALLKAVLESAGATDLAAREKAFAGGPVDPALDAYLAKVRSESYRVTDADVGDLRAGGHPEDAIFELTVAAALGGAARGLAAALRALREAG
jgi:hypothetical protein